MPFLKPWWGTSDQLNIKCLPISIYVPTLICTLNDISKVSPMSKWIYSDALRWMFHLQPSSTSKSFPGLCRWRTSSIVILVANRACGHSGHALSLWSLDLGRPCTVNSFWQGLVLKLQALVKNAKVWASKYHYRALACRIDKENVISSPTPSSLLIYRRGWRGLM